MRLLVILENQRRSASVLMGLQGGVPRRVDLVRRRPWTDRMGSLMFNENEIEALLLGARIVQSWPTLNSLRLRLRQR